MKSQGGTQYLSNTHNDIENGVTSHTQNQLYGDIAQQKFKPSTS